MKKNCGVNVLFVELFIFILFIFSQPKPMEITDERDEMHKTLICQKSTINNQVIYHQSRATYLLSLSAEKN